MSHTHHFKRMVFSSAMPDFLGIKCECGKFVSEEDIAAFVNELSAQQNVHPAVLQVGQGVVTCPKCFTAWIIELPKPHIG